MIRYTILLSTILFYLQTFSQKSLDILSLGAQYGVPSSYDNSDLYPQKANENTFNLNLALPVPINEKNIFYNSISYFYANVTTQNQLPSNLVNPINIHGIILQTGLLHRFDEKNGMLLLAVPRLMGDFETFNSKVIQPGAIAMYERKYSEKLLMRYGLLYNQELYGPYFVPLVYINWDINRRWTLSGLFPIYMRASYEINKNLSVGFYEFALYTSYYLSNPNYRDNYLSRTSIDLNVFARQRLYKNFILELRAGYALGRNYEQYAGDDKINFGFPLALIGDNRKVVNPLFGDGPIFNFRLVYNLPLNKDENN